MWSHQVLDSKLCELRKQERRNTEELARKNEKLESELKAAEEGSERLNGDLRG